MKALSILDAAWSWPKLCLYGHGMFVGEDALTPELQQSLASLTQTMSSPRSLILVAPAAPPSHLPSSLSFRGGFFLSAYAMWPRTPDGPEADGDSRHAQWVAAVRQAVGQACLGLYVNEVMLEPGQVAACYSPHTYTRLQRLKQECDPLGLLRPL
ncbi:FAD-binding PCMH-type domain-containing protein [Haematococcus lacustris]|uniref:FAD-binding PCMH-type domain-containing protein n=1 Tax=Haematococcus lacustris TaxID=44745 RepID=A0A699ZGM0_HAELA|nr:FAD-binding PCMH-type domain-containing protein [Haematococcus lacustris]